MIWYYVCLFVGLVVGLLLAGFLRACRESGEMDEFTAMLNKAGIRLLGEKKEGV